MTAVNEALQKQAGESVNEEKRSLQGGKKLWEESRVEKPPELKKNARPLCRKGGKGSRPKKHLKKKRSRVKGGKTALWETF